MKKDLVPTIISNWKLWIPFQLLNFRLVPQPLQVGSANVFAVLWNIYLSYTTHRAVVDGKPVDDGSKKKK